MHNISANTKLDTILQKSPLTFKVLSDYGVELCCFEKNLTLFEACKSHNLAIEPLILSLQALANPPIYSYNERDSLSTLVQKLSNDHHYYLSTLIPHLRLLIKKLSEEKQEPFRSAIAQVREIIPEFLAEITHHVLMETDELFPYIVNLEGYSKGTVSLAEIEKQLKFRSVCALNDGEYRTGYFFTRFKEILFQYHKSPQNPLLFNLLLDSLSHFEFHIQEHEIIEDLQLLPPALEIENACREKLGQN